MRARLALLTLALAALAWGIGACGSRDRANPFDPANRSTGGAPIGFEALARDGEVDLVWQGPGTPGLSGFQVWRRTAAESSFRAITAVLPPASTGYVDRGLLNGLDHTYRLYYVFADGTKSSPVQDIATPGPQTPWVADGAGELDEITADGRHIAVSHGGLTRPTSVAVDPTTRRVWSSDPDAAQVREFDLLNGTIVTIPLGGTPGTIGIAPTDSTAWVCREDAGSVTQLAPGGRQIATLSGFVLPIGVAVSGLDGTIWVCDRDGNRVAHHDPDLGALPSVTVTAPSRVAIDATTGEAWVTSFTGATVWKLSSTGATLLTIPGLAGPVGIAVDPGHGNVWVTDPLRDRVRVLATDGSTRFDVNGLPGADAVALDPVTGEAWVLAFDSGELVRIATNGTVVRRLGGFAAPNDVALMR